MFMFYCIYLFILNAHVIVVGIQSINLLCKFTSLSGSFWEQTD